MLDFIALAQQCAPTVAPQTMAAVVHVESGFNPLAIGVVGGRLARQPTTLEEAVATAQSLEAEGWNFSVGVTQVNRYNLPKYQLTYAKAFDACANMRVGSKILEECYGRAIAKMPGQEQAALQAAFSCYYSGNFTRGFKADRHGNPSYVQKVLASADVAAKAIPVVPNITKDGKAVKPRADVAADATAAAPVVVTATPTPSVAAEPADHSSVLIDLTPRRAVSTADKPALAGDQADTPVSLKAARPQDVAPAATNVAPQDATIF